jgi:hypothetical protein
MNDLQVWDGYTRLKKIILRIFNYECDLDYNTYMYNEAPTAPKVLSV